MKKLNQISIFVAVAFIFSCSATISKDMQLSNQALQSIRNGNYIEAENNLKQALADNPNNPYALLNLGVVYQNTKRTSEARVIYEKVIKLNSQDVVGQSNIEGAGGKTLTDLAKDNLNMLIPAEDSTDRGTARFIAYSNGTVLDTKTNLMWAAKDNGVDINWVNAKSYCEAYRGGGYSDWRMPIQDELVGLYDADQARPAACYSSLMIHAATDLIDITCFAHWVSETRGSDAAIFYFSTGNRGWYPLSHEGLSRTLPVRSVK